MKNVVSGDVDMIGNGFFDRYPGNGLYLDLDGVAADPGGRLESVQTFDPGTYELQLDLAGGGAANSANNLVTVSLGLGFSSRLRDARSLSTAEIVCSPFWCMVLEFRNLLPQRGRCLPNP